MGRCVGSVMSGWREKESEGERVSVWRGTSVSVYVQKGVYGGQGDS